MSPAATGPAHARATSLNGGGPVKTTNGVSVNGFSGAKGYGRTFEHLTDLQKVKPNVDKNSSLRKLIQDGEVSAKQAQTYLDFKRPDIALQEYIKASIIAVEYIPQHPNYPELQADRGDLHRLYAGLKKRINSQHTTFEDVKRIVRDNNTRSGVRPVSEELSSSTSGQGFPNGLPSTSASHTSNGTSSQSTNDFINGLQPLKLDTSSQTSAHRVLENKPKPPVQPKPQGLHGNSIRFAPNGTSSGSLETDLAKRFAQLRSAESASPTQDPRIRTRPIAMLDTAQTNGTAAVHLPQNSSVVRPQGPRDMPSAPTASMKPGRPALAMDIPTMPRPPDAIYSPARSADTVSTNKIPPVISRVSSYIGDGARRDSVASATKSSRTPTPIDSRRDYFFPGTINYSLDNHIHPSPNRASELQLPSSSDITAEVLMEYIRRGAHNLSLLLVDIRSRDQFDLGHIYSQSIICVEPISIREDLSAEDLGERLVLSPEAEQKLYNQRDYFDLVVYYDQSSKAVDTGEDVECLRKFRNIIHDYAYDKRLRRPPVLLDGGLDAWVDLVGQQALQTSNTLKSTAVKSRPENSLKRGLAIREPQYNTSSRRIVPESRILSAPEEERWDEALKNYSTEEDSDEFSYARTTEDFLRRYPEVPAPQQSMAFPSIPRSMPHNDAILISTPPTRPPPALPRQRSSGVSEKAPYTSYAMTGGPQMTLTNGLCGLNNITGASCYMNSVIQALSASPAIRGFLVNFKYPPRVMPPKKGNETGDPKFLMTRNLSSLLAHMWCGKYQVVVPRMFQKYVHVTHALTDAGRRVGPDRCFGSRTQQDSSEFLSWLIDVLLDEFNLHRDVKPMGSVNLPRESSQKSRLQICREAYQEACKAEESFLSRLLSSQLMIESTCTNCNVKRYSYESFRSWTTLSGELATSPIMKLGDLLATFTGTEGREDVDCEDCKRKCDRNVSQKFSHLSDYLILDLNRVSYDAYGAGRENARISFPQVLDMTPYTWLSDTTDPLSSRLPDKQRPPFLYDCYAVIQHKGTSSSGHYWTLARRTNTKNELLNEWWEYNDVSVTPTEWAKTQGPLTRTIFYRRRGVN